MANKKKVYLSILAIFAFIAYTLLAAQPVPPETILTNNWLVSLGTDQDTEELSANKTLIPFKLGKRFGYVSNNGTLFLNKEQEQTVSLSPEFWTEFDPSPRVLIINDPLSGAEIILENPQAYPVFLDGRILLISKDQTSLEEIDKEGITLWRYDFEAPLTCIDAAGGYIITGSLDGMIDLLDRQGERLFPSFAPGGSRIPVIFGCRISSDGSKLAIVSGIDKQRFLFLELYGNNDYRVTHHEFLPGEGFRREVHMAFIENDTRVVFEQEAGLGIYNVKSRSTVTLPLPGQMEGFPVRLETLDEEGADGLFFYISSGTSRGEKRFVALKLPGKELINVPFKSEVSFLTRRGKELLIGGGQTLASFTLDKR
ncbi:MAG: WD40 repeat domain-containing protein [Treponema sp.]|nr:WD40 repeat domain-containing protein [Treponema sp.]